MNEEQLTSAEVYAMTPQERSDRLDSLIADSLGLLKEARVALLKPGQRVTARCLMFSGGDDSTVLAHLFRNRASHAIHANTGIGIEETREHVRACCRLWGVPLIEETAGDYYERYVLEHGFPGPGAHHRMYQRLKERCFRKAVKRILGRSRTNRVVFIAGRRREESERRKDIPLYEVLDGRIWVSPLATWTKADLAEYRHRFPDCPRNPVSANLHMSGECLCGAYAHPGELSEIGFFYPHVREYIEHLEHRVVEAGIAPPDRCKWGRERPDETDTSDGPACGNCKSRVVAA